MLGALTKAITEGLPGAPLRLSRTITPRGAAPCCRNCCARPDGNRARAALARSRRDPVLLQAGALRRPKYWSRRHWHPAPAAHGQCSFALRRQVPAILRVRRSCPSTASAQLAIYGSAYQGCWHEPTHRDSTQPSARYSHPPHGCSAAPLRLRQRARTVRVRADDF